MKQLTIILLCFVSVSAFAQTQIDSGQIRRLPIAKLVTPTTPSNGQVIKYNSTSGKWEPGTDSGGSVSPGGITNSIQANDGAGGLKADTTVKLGSYLISGGRNAVGIKIGKNLGTILSPADNPALILSPKFTTNGGVPNIIFESPSGHSESWPFAFAQFSDDNSARLPSIGDPNRPSGASYNEVVMWGFNPGNMFGTPSQSKPSLWYAMEPNWYNGGQKWAEFHMSIDWGNGEHRIFTTEIQNIKNTPTNILNWRGDGFQFSGLRSNKTYIAGGGGGNPATATLGVFAGSGISAQFYADSANKQVIIRNYAPTSGDVFRIQGYDEITLGPGDLNTLKFNTTNGYAQLKGITSTTSGNLIETGQGFNISRSGAWPTGIKFTEGTEFASILLDGGSGAFTTFLRGTGGYYYRWLMGTDEVMTINSSRNIGINQASPNSRLHITGSQASSILVISANTTLDGTHHTAIIPNGSTFTVTLPSAASITGRIYRIINKTSGSVTIGSYVNLAGSTVTTVATATAIIVQSDGTNWQQIQ